MGNRLGGIVEGITDADMIKSKIRYETLVVGGCWNFVSLLRRRSASVKEGTQRNNWINGFKVKKEHPICEIVAMEKKRMPYRQDNVLFVSSVLKFDI